jgi:hypothetical protein
MDELSLVLVITVSPSMVTNNTYSQSSRNIGDTIITKATYTIYSSNSLEGTSVGDTVFTITSSYSDHQNMMLLVGGVIPDLHKVKTVTPKLRRICSLIPFGSINIFLQASIVY